MYTFDETTPSTDFSVTGLKNSDTVDSCGAEQRGRSSDGNVCGARSDLCDHGQQRYGNWVGQLHRQLHARDADDNPGSVDSHANNASKTYGDTYTFDTTTPSTDFLVTGTLYNGDTVDSVTLSSAGAVATAMFVAPGPTYPIAVSAASGTGLGNYMISYTPGTLTISQASLSVAANNASKPYGDVYTFDTTTPSTDFSVTGLKNSDTVASVTLNSTGAVSDGDVRGASPTYRSRLGAPPEPVWATTSLATRLRRSR